MKTQSECKSQIWDYIPTTDEEKAKEKAERNAIPFDFDAFDSYD